MLKRTSDFKIIRTRFLNEENFVLDLLCPDEECDFNPGQFVNVSVEHSKTTFLRRPISVHDFRKSENILSLFVQIVGDGTRQLSLLNEGDKLNLIYPLGNHFCYSESKKPLLIGGGCGVAPLLYLARKVSETGVKPDILMGGRSLKNILLLEEYSAFGKIYTITEDGSHGEKGMVTQHSLFENLKNYDKIFVCGPNGMMKAIAKFALKENVDCEVSLENTMACGIGACLCCVEDTIKGHVCVCTEGPIFNIKDLKW